MAFEFINLPARQEQILVLTTNNTIYLIGITQQGDVLHLYWGPKLANHYEPADYPSIPANNQLTGFDATVYHLLAEYPVRVGVQQFEPALKLIFSDGTQDLRLGYLSHHYDETTYTLELTLKDDFYPLEVILIYRMYEELDLLTRQARIVNKSDAAVTLEAALSGSVVLPADRGDFKLWHLSGAWASENQIECTPITPGRKVLESRLNQTGHGANPFLALENLGQDGTGASELSGNIWYGNLEWSGNWKTVVEQVRVPYPLTRFGGGLNNWDFDWQLGGGESFTTPRLILGFTSFGWHTLSHNLQRFQLRYCLPRPAANQVRPVLYNSWEAVEFEVNEAVQKELATKAARLGVEVFVVDDGWFGERNNSHAGLGDWYINPAKFPHGFGPLIKHVNRLGMQFGVWIEPEMVNPDSELYRQHPDWVYHFPNRKPLTGRNQLMLNLTLPSVQDWLWNWLNELLTANNIGYIKWDFNRSISEIGGQRLDGRRHPRELWVRHIQALYDLLDRLRAAHPRVLFEACSGGGGRTDPAILTHFDHIWASDNTDPFDRLSINQGYLLAYPAKTMYGWVTQTDRHAGNYNLRYRFHSAFMGSLGIGADLSRWNETELEEASKLVDEYKRLREIIQHGNFHRLTPLNSKAGCFAVEYLSDDKKQGLLLAFATDKYMWEATEKVRLAGLEPEKRYRIRGDVAEAVMSGQALMWWGISPNLGGQGHYQSALVEFFPVES